MPKLKGPEVQDLQSFLNNFHNEIEDGNVLTITPDNVGEDKVVRKIMMANQVEHDKGVENDGREDEDDNNDNDDNIDDGDVENIYYLDDEGNCYIRTSLKQEEQQELETEAKQSSSNSPQAVSSTGRVKYSRVKVATTGKKNVSAASLPSVKRGQETKRSRRKLTMPLFDEENSAMVKAEDVEELVDDPDSTEEMEQEVYEFEETPLVSSKQYKLKPVPVEPIAQKYSCTQCDYTTGRKFFLSRHLRTHESDRPFKCSLCDRGFKTNISLVNHLNTHMGKKPHQCKLCESAFTTSGELIRHTRYKHTKEKPHKCSECSYASVELTKLRRHMTCHTGERPFQCPHCTYASPDMFKLKRHMVTHTGEKKYQCDICKSRFTQSNSLKSHKLIHSVVDKPAFQCTLCPTTCGRKADLRQHMTNMHSSDKPIPCKRCNQELPDRYQYKLHIKTHEGEKCYRCKLCCYASVSQRHLDSHMLVHTNEKPFQCDQCHLHFRHRQLLKRHINIFHNDAYKPPSPRDKQHLCPTCGRCYTHKGNLMRHMECHDPTMNANEEKLQRKLGRSMRLQPDGSVVTVVKKDDLKMLCYAKKGARQKDGSESQTEDDNNSGEFIEDLGMIDEDDDDGAIVQTVNIQNEPVIINRQLKPFTSIYLKDQPVPTEFTVELQGEEQYVVMEVVSSDDEFVDVKEEPTGNDTKISENNCFGFENDEDSYQAYNEQEGEDDGPSQEFMQLMDIIDQDS